MAILAVNAGSSSLKFSVHPRQGAQVLPALLTGSIQGLEPGGRPSMGWRFQGTPGEQILASAPGDEPFALALRALQQLLGALPGLPPIEAVAHRVVHGGEHFRSSVQVDDEVLAQLGRLNSLAPLHQPHNLAPIRIVAERAPQLPQVACFDTGFHRAQPELAQAFALPPDITGRGVRRYGFHGLSYEYIASSLPGIDAKAAAGRVVVAHLGNGASMCAMHAGKSVASTMGFTAVDGLMMGTRCGTIDPGVVLYLMDELKMDARAIEKLIYQQSGLLGVSGISSDMRTLLASTEPRAKLAVDLFVYRIGRELGSLAAALGGLDALVFTGGIGERSAQIRERVCRNAAWLGVALDPAANEAGGPGISAASSRIPAWAIPTNEELMIARHTRRLIGAAAAA